MVEAVMSKEVWCNRRYSVTMMRKLHANITEMSHLTSTGMFVGPREELCGTFFLFFFFDLGKTGHGFSEIQLGHGVVYNITLETNERSIRAGEDKREKE